MESAVKAPLSERINLRIIAFAAVLIALIGFPVGVYVKQIVSGGIVDVGEYKQVDLKTMVSFPFDQVNGTVNDVPAKWRALDGKKVILTGEIYDPSSSGRYIDSFVLVYSISKCCVGVPPQAQHLIQSKPIDGAKLEYLPNLVQVKGTLHVNVVRDQDKVNSVFALDVESVEPL